MINIPWFLVPHFYLLSVQSYKRLKLRAFKEWLFRKTNGRQIRVVRINTFVNVLYVHNSWAERYTSSWITHKKVALMNNTEIIIPLRIKFGSFENRSRSFSFSHFLKKENWTNLTISWKLFINVLIQKLEVGLKSSLNEQKYSFLTFNMKKCHVFLVTANFFLSEIN